MARLFHSLRAWGWVAALGLLTTVALVPAAPASAASAQADDMQGAEPCHKGHCHGPEVCGGGWKDYREPARAEASGDGAETACAAAEALLTERASAQAAERCVALHRCGDCPEGCSGCKSERPAGRIDAEAARRKTSPLPEGGTQCSIETEAIYRCRCGPCKKPPADG